MSETDVHPPKRGEAGTEASTKTVAVLSRLRKATGACLTFIGEVTSPGLNLSAFDGRVVGPLRGALLNAGHGLGGRVLVEKRPAALSDYFQSTSITHTYDEIIRAELLQTLVAVPVIVARRQVAVLYAATRIPTVEVGRLLDATVHEARALEQGLVVEDLLRNTHANVPNPQDDWRTRARDAYGSLQSIAREIDDLALRAKILEAAQILAGESTRERPPVSVTRREHDVLVLVAAGMTNQAVADHLGIGLYTVKGHMKNLMHKLSASSRLEVVVNSRRAQLLP
ncbi:helix-turn-helix transcriptional regulator [Rhodococcus sp. APC 3903]|uniref:helix-turn-helix transcriptional regulator n=1 Tax=Rhodococcus sp. APC 3903 TaxID=3035193 RepID=UPI0025B34A51|nr:helix-turn-helix transcriptional regulator [Rhodococcus sp. APC 3903]MDN3459874.1 helix-turn-helix transcriptional regulator [Rhodococcus sp. APC 3903]